MPYNTLTFIGARMNATTLELSCIDLGEKEPAYAQITLLTACSTTVVFCVYFLTFLFCGFNNKREEMY